MKTLSKSPDRFTFQRENYIKRRLDEGKTMSEIEPDVELMFDDPRKQKEELENNPEWWENNMEADMRSCDWMVAKVRSSVRYSQNLYAAMCNREFYQPKDDEMTTIHILADTLSQNAWTCSWRYAGGIIADMRGNGDYIDWYCSGIKNYSESEGKLRDVLKLTEEQKEWYDASSSFVGEGMVTDEIREDLKKLGWIVLPDDMDRET
jgi:hypothetical protein